MSLDEVRTFSQLSHLILFTNHFVLQRFNEAAEKVKSLTKRPTDQELLDLYALFKQASFGDNTTSEYHDAFANFGVDSSHSLLIHSFTGRPGMFDLKGKAKWNSWDEKKGMSQDEAKEKYIVYVDELLAKYL